MKVYISQVDLHCKLFKVHIFVKGVNDYPIQHVFALIIPFIDS